MSGIGHNAIVVGNTGDVGVDGLLTGRAWLGAITYSFPQTNGEYDAGYQNDTPFTNFAPISTLQQEAFYFAMDADLGVAAAAGFSVEGFTNLDVSLTTAEDANIRAAFSSNPNPTAFAYYPGTGYQEAGDVWFGDNYNGTVFDYNFPEHGNYAFHTLIHEIGHALGLEHSHEGNLMPAELDQVTYTVMSYRAYEGASLTAGYSYELGGAPQTFMMYDIAALQHMYGADYTTNSGDNTYKWTPGSGDTMVDGIIAINPGTNRIFATIWDGGGTDTYDLSSYTTGLNIDLRPGEHSIFNTAQLSNLGAGNIAVGNIFNALLHLDNTASLIENAWGGSGNDTIQGNEANNYLLGNNGKDTLLGGDGDDTLEGGGGASDILDGGNGMDTATYQSSTNRVIINLATDSASSGHAANDTFISIENITGSNFGDTITGDNGANVISGGNGKDVLSGFNGNDTLLGGGGNDFMVGGAGADIIDGGAGGADVARYIGSNAGVAINLSTGTASGGHAQGDTLTNVEFLFGSSFDDNFTGDGNNNWLFGAAGNDTLDGAGGIDKFFGGAGNDTFVFGDADDFGYVTDFEDDVDQIDVSSYGFSNLAEALSNFSQNGANVRFFVDGDTLLILNTDLNDLMDDIVI